MKTEWDYTALADAYLKRPAYSDVAINAMLAVSGLREGRVCDIGAGVAHLALMLAARGFEVTAVEPNDAMRAHGSQRTAHFSNVHWFEGTGEHTAQVNKYFDLVTFGSSFNVCNRPMALRETARILKPNSWFACLWNHRWLEDPIQRRIESIIKEVVPSYHYGTRREDQRSEIEASGLFGPVIHLDAQIIHEQSIEACVEAWQSHATLARQAGDSFLDVVQTIQEYLASLGRDRIQIPYTTNVWMAQLAL